MKRLLLIALLALPLAAQTGPSQCIWTGYDYDTREYKWVCAGEASGLAISRTSAQTPIP